MACHRGVPVVVIVVPAVIRMIVMPTVVRIIVIIIATVPVPSIHPMIVAGRHEIGIIAGWIDVESVSIVIDIPVVYPATVHQIPVDIISIHPTG